jgi:hypothetical protein
MENNKEKTKSEKLTSDLPVGHCQHFKIFLLPQTDEVINDEELHADIANAVQIAARGAAKARGVDIACVYSRVCESPEVQLS